MAEDLPPAPTGVSAILTDGTFTITWDTMNGADNYEVQYRTEDTDSEWTGLPETTGVSATYTLVGGPDCGTEYRFRVRAYGDGDTYTEMWSVESDAETVETASCVPEFGQASYIFEVTEDAQVDDPVGTVTATDEDTDDLTYSISVGNTGNVFSIVDETGAIAVAAALDHETTPSYTLTVQVDDGNGGTVTATVTISVTDVAEDPPPAPLGLSVSLTAGTFTLAWDEVAGAAKYEVQHKIDPADSQWAALPETTALTQTYTPDGGPQCGTEYQFRVRAYGDGQTYTAMWGVESEVESIETATCDPEFDQASYSFFILDTSAIDNVLGTVSATDLDTEDTVRYSITGGNDGGKFSINSTTGQLTVAGTLDIATTPSYSLTVEASDGKGGKDTARVTVALTIAACANGTVVPRPDEYPRLVRDCSVLLTAKDTLRGAANLNWSPNTPLRQWQGIFTGYLNRQYTLDGDTIHVTAVIVARIGLNGTIPPVLEGLVDLRRLDLDDNALTGNIPAELGNLLNLRILSLYANDLTGNIPHQLGKLTKLEQLLLDDNDFTGQLPSELGNIAGPERLFVRESRLTGEIPAWLTTLDDLEHLYLEGNDFTGCIPTGLRDVDNNDLDRPGLSELPDCSSQATASTDISYAFLVAEDASVGDTVGTVTSTDLEGDTITYRITAGNTGNAFDIDGSTVAITVAQHPRLQDHPSYTLTVQASDGSNGTDTVIVTISVTDVAEDPPPAPANLSTTLTAGVFTLTWDKLAGAAKYEAQHKTDAADSAWTALSETTALTQTYTPVGGEECGTTYKFRVRAYGDGETYTEMWGTEYGEASVETANCDPEFDQDPHGFDVAEDAEVNAEVGTVSATDEDTDDELTYSITGGNEDEKFDIDGSSGAITVVDDLDYEIDDSYTLTVQVDHGNGGSDTATVTITAGDVAEEELVLWSGTMTAGTFAMGLVNAYGYTSGVTVGTTPTGGPHGALDDTSFTYGGETYTVKLATYVQGANNTPLFMLGLDERRLPSDTEIALYVGSHRLTGFATTGLSNLDTMYYYVNNIDFALTEGQEVALSLKKTNPSNDTDLASLALSAGTLIPDFDAAKGTYTATVANDVTQVSVTAKASSDYATVSMSPNGGDDAATEGVEVALNVGENTLSVTVTSEDGRTRTYTVIVTREAV